MKGRGKSMTGKEIYELWCKQSEGKGPDGNPLPSWEELAPLLQRNWTGLGSEVSTLPDGGPPDPG